MLFILFFSNTTVSALDLAKYPVLRQLANEAASNDEHKKNTFYNILGKAKINPDVVELMNRQYESLPWFEYRKIFMSQNRIDKGVNFLHKHRETLNRAEKQYGVPATIIAALIGVETNYGRQTGNMRVLDSLVTLVTSGIERRKKYFKNELKEFLDIVVSNDLDPVNVLGSYAGAIGIPQFMPSSYAKYSIDFDDDGFRDLVESNSDAIGSIANYLNRHGWKREQSIAWLVDKGENGKIRNLASKKFKPRLSIDKIRIQGIKIPKDVAGNKVAVIPFKLEKDREYLVGFKNFYVLTRYNPSSNYARTVYELAMRLQERQSNQYTGS